MDNLSVRALGEEMAYIKGYTDALEEINGKRRQKQAQQKKKSELDPSKLQTMTEHWRKKPKQENTEMTQLEKSY